MTEPNQATWDDLPLYDREAFIRKHLATIRKAWPHLADPPATRGSSRSAPASRIPTNADILSLRAEVTRDLTYWCRSLMRDHPDGRPPRLDLTDTPAMLAHLMSEARWASGWTYGKRFAFEMADHAFDATRLAWPRTDTYLIGECPNTIGADGVAVTCGTPVRVNRNHPGDVKCRGCGLTDTVDGWLLRIVGDQRLVTAEQLVPLLHKRLGVVVKPATIRKWKERDELPAAGVDDHGRDLFDRHHAFLVVTRREARNA